jgi:hypothetical protein
LSALLIGSWVPGATALELTDLILNETSGPDAHLTICFTTVESNLYVIESAVVDSEPPVWIAIPSTETIGDGTEQCLEVIQTNGTAVSRLRLASGFVGTIEAEDVNGGFGVALHATSISSLGPGDWARYDNIDLGGIDTIEFVLATITPGKRIQIRIGSPTGTVIARLTADSTGDLGTFTSQSAGVLPTSGIHSIYLTSPDGGDVFIDKFILRVEGPVITIPGTYGSGVYSADAYGG